MGRDSNGAYTSPSADFVAGTVILSNVMNAKLTDLGTEITNSLDRFGRGGMLAHWRGIDGTAALPAYAFTAETTLGLYRAGTADLRATSNGTNIQKWGPTEVRVYQSAFTEKGLTATNSTANGAGVTSTGNGTGAGGAFTGGATGAGLTAAGGATSGPGGTFTSTSGHGLSSTGAGVGNAGVSAVGPFGALITGTVNEAVVGIGAPGSAGGWFRNGTDATAATPQNGAILTNGNLLLSGVAPNSNVSIGNTLTPTNIPKAWGVFTSLGDGSGGVTIDDGFNITSATITGGDLVVTLGSDMANANYLAMPQVIGSALFSASPITLTAGTSRFDVKFFNAGAFNDHDLNANITTMQVIWFGRQP